MTPELMIISTYFEILPTEQFFQKYVFKAEIFIEWFLSDVVVFQVDYEPLKYEISCWGSYSRVLATFLRFSFTLLDEIQYDGTFFFHFMPVSHQN